MVYLFSGYLLIKVYIWNRFLNMLWLLPFSFGVTFGMASQYITKRKAYLIYDITQETAV